MLNTRRIPDPTVLEIASKKLEDILTSLIDQFKALKAALDEKIVAELYKLTEYTPFELGVPEGKIEKLFVSTHGKELPLCIDKYLNEKGFEQLKKNDFIDFCKYIIDQSITSMKNYAEIQALADTTLLKQQLLGEIFLLYALHVYEDTKNKHLSSTLVLAFKTINYTEYHFRKPFVALQFLADFIFFTVESKELWDNVVSLLNGLYYYTYNKYPDNLKDKNGEICLDQDHRYPPIPTDERDKKFKSAFKMTQYDIAIYHADISDLLRYQIEKTAENDQKQETFPKNEVDDHHQIVTQNENIPLKETLSFPQMEILQDKNQPKIVITFPSAYIEKLPIVCDQINQLMANILCPELTNPKRDELPDYLRNFEEKDEDTKIERLMTYISTYGLSEENKKSLFTLPSLIETNFSIYKNNTYLFPRWHNEYAEQAMKSTKTTNDPAQQLIELFDLRNKLKIETSRELLPKVNEIFMKAFDFLANPQPSYRMT